MKKVFTLLTLLLCMAFESQAQEIAFTLDRTRHDFGTLTLGKSDTTTFTITSTGTKPLVLLDATTGCKCTKATFPKKPLRQGEKAIITVTFDADQAGVFYKQILVHTNAPQKMELRVNGVVKKVQ